MPTVNQREAKQAWKEALREKSDLVRQVAETELGARLFELLEETFERRSLVGDGPHETYYRLGQRDVVQYLRELREVSKNV